MAFEFDFDEMFRWCAIYLDKGFRIVRLHGIRPDGTCTCNASECRVGGANQRNCGKHPVGSKWKDRYARSEDDVLGWDDGVPFNVGIILGPDSGHVDNEDDSPEGKAFRSSLGLDNYETPSYTSGKSTHQITLWDDKLSDCEGVVKPGNLECRLGAGGASIQSVLPPSWHNSGVKYKWKPGLSPDEIDVAPTPRDLLVQMVNYDSAGTGSGGGKKHAGPLVFRKVHDGEGRHGAVLMWAWEKIVTCVDPESRKDIITQEVLDANEKYVNPKKEVEEVLKIVNSCFNHYRRKRHELGWTPSPSDMTQEAVEEELSKIDANDSVEATGFASHGLERYQAGTVEAYRPGNWSIQMIQGDPPEVILCVPAWANTPCRGRIQMSFDTFRSAAKVASTVFLATRRVILDGDTAKWHAVWKGVDASKKNGFRSIPGIMQQLVERKNAQDDIEVGTSSLRYAQLAGYVLQVFRKATTPRNEEKPEPNESGRPCWVTPDELWFQWAKIWEDIGRQHDIAPGERNRIRSRLIDMMGVRDFEHKRHRFESCRLEYVVFSREWVAALETLAAGEDRGQQIGPVKGEADELFEKSSNHSPSTVHETETVEA